MSKWGCRCGAIWTSEDDNPPESRMCYAMCPKPPLFKLAEKEESSTTIQKTS